MRIARRWGLALVAACAFSAIAVSSASAFPLFLSHPAGILLLATADDPQIFFTPANGLEVECKSVKLLPPDTTPALRFLSILITVDYETCDIPSISANATVHPVQYLIYANGLVRLENTVLILAPLCTITIPAAKNQSLNTVKFDNQKDGSLLLLVRVKGVTSSGAGVGCTYAEEDKGGYEGDIRVVAHGGTIRWDP